MNVYCAKIALLSYLGNKIFELFGLYFGTNKIIPYFYRKFSNPFYYEKNQTIPVSHDHLFNRIVQHTKA